MTYHNKEIFDRIDVARANVIRFSKKAAEAERDDLPGFADLYRTLERCNRRRIKRLRKLVRWS